MTGFATISDRPSNHANLDQALHELRAGSAELARISLDQRIQLLIDCVRPVSAEAHTWVEAACEAKQIPRDSPARSEEIAAGPISLLRYLRLLIATLKDIRSQGQPQLPGKVRRVDGQVRVPIFPTRQLFDGLLFGPLRAEAWISTGTRSEDVVDLFAESIRRVAGASSAPAVCCVLGAGNVSAIPITDSLTKMLQFNKAVLLKMNPVNEYLGPIFQRGLAPLIQKGFLRIVYGAGDVGGYLVNHDNVDEIHITGSTATHDAIVWGATAESQRATAAPRIDKTITSELGNVSPWVVYPADYTHGELQFQAENVAASITNNASFNCIATKMLVTSEHWPQRIQFLDLLDRVLQSTPKRAAFYPGAADRFERFSGAAADDPTFLPWKLIRDATPADSPHMFREESFVCVCGETALDIEDPRSFLRGAVEFANERLWGTLAAAITIPVKQELATLLDDALRELRYGTIGVNQWPAVAYALMSPPWGGHPSSTLANVQSGIGFVHNTFLLDSPEKTILRSPLKTFPKPLWFSTHRRPEQLAWKLLELYANPSPTKLPPILINALRG